MAEASVLISICTNLHSVRVDGTGHVSQFQTSRCRIRSTPKTKTIFHHIHFERDKSFMRSSVHYLRQSVKPRSDRWLSKSGNVRTCTGLRPQIDSHEASKGLQMNHKVNSNGLSCSPPCFVCHMKRHTKFTKSKFRYQKLTEIEFTEIWSITEIRLTSALCNVNTKAAN